MLLRKHAASSGPRWSLDGHLVPVGITLGFLLTLPRNVARTLLASLPLGETVDVRATLAPIDADQEVWASGVTYLRSRDARRAESKDADVYERVYDADRPEIFFKATGRRAVGHGAPVRIRADSRWNVPEPELVLVLDHAGDIVGFTAGNDMSSRDIEGENPLYLPQAKVYEGSCAIGPAILLIDDPAELRDVPIAVRIERGGSVVFDDSTSTDQMRRGFEELAECLYRELRFPNGALLMTGTSLVPPEDFTLQPGDHVTIRVGELVLANPVEPWCSP